MRRVIIILLLAGGLLFGAVGQAMSGGPCTCVHWECVTICSPDTSSCTTRCYCAAEECYGWCASGSYPCNRDGGGCCPIGVNPNRPDNSGCWPGTYPDRKCWEECGYTCWEDCYSCFPAGTKVKMAGGKTKNIEDVEADERMKAPHPLIRFLSAGRFGCGWRPRYEV